MEQQVMAGLKLVPPPDGFDPIESQRTLQQLIHEKNGGLYLDRPAVKMGELADRITAQDLNIRQEMAELIDGLPWKPWSTRHREARAEPMDPELTVELKFEVIDVFHFVLNLAIALGMSWDEFMTIYHTKQIENRARQERGY